jgi:hypothetical protein
MRSISPVPEVQARRLANRLASRQAELIALRAIAANVNQFTTEEVAVLLRDTIKAAERGVQAATVDTVEP